jgi:hypothetical protein
MTNPFVLFQSLLPRRPLEIGTVTAVETGYCTVELPGGGVLRARGQARLGDKVFVRDGAIEGEAPDLPVVTIDV